MNRPLCSRVYKLLRGQRGSAIRFAYHDPPLIFNRALATRTLDTPVLCAREIGAEAYRVISQTEMLRSMARMMEEISDTDL